jgi:hypothetical protein
VAVREITSPDPSPNPNPNPNPDQAVSEASVQGLAEVCAAALQLVLELEKSLQRYAQSLRLGCASDDAPR